MATKRSRTKPNSKDATRPPTLHVKFEKRFQILDVASDSDDDSSTLHRYHFTLHDDDDEDNYVYVPTPLTVEAILADVDRQLADHPTDVATAPSDGGDVDTNDEDHAHLVRMDTHVRAIMASANPRLLALNTALGHTHPLPPLDEERIAAEIAAIYAYYGHTSPLRRH